MAQNREQTTYNKLVMYDEETKEGVILDYTFKHGDGFKGMTGTYFRVESKQEHRSYTSLRNIKEVLKDSVAEDERPMGLTAWAKQCKAEDENFPYDSSANEHLEYIRKELGLTEKECFFLSCFGGGRCFDKDTVFTHNKDLQYLVKEFEG